MSLGFLIVVAGVILPLLISLIVYDRITQKEFIQNATVVKKYMPQVKKGSWLHWMYMYGLESGSSSVYNSLLHSPCLLSIELERGGRDYLEVDMGTCQRTPEGTVFQVHCAKGAIFGARVKKLS